MSVMSTIWSDPSDDQAEGDDPGPSGQLAEDRWGRAYRIDLGWAPPKAPAGAGDDVGDRHPPPAPGCRRSPPPLLNQDPLQEPERNQEPAPSGPAGVRTGGMGSLGGISQTAERAPTSIRAGSKGRAKAAAKPPPRLDDVRPENLAETGRLLDLHRQATARGLVGPSEADRLRFVAAAEHALAIGRGNPPGLFAYLIRGGLWRYLTREDEDRANARIKRELWGVPGSRPVGGPMVAGRGSGPSADARLVREVRSATIRAGISRDPFPEFLRLNPGWDRARWDAEWGGAGGLA